MRARIVLFVVLAVVTALVGVYAGWSTNTPKAVGEPSTATPSDSSVGPTQRRGSGSGPARSPAAPPSKAPPSKAPPPKAPPPQACSPTAAVQPAAYATPSGQEPETEPASQPQEGAHPVRFGPVATTPSGPTADTNIADDGRALTTGFSDREVQVWKGSTECDATRSFAMTLPLTDGAKGETLTVLVQGYAFSEVGASGRLTLRLNGLVKVSTFPAGSDKSYVQTLQVPAIPATTYRLSGVIEVHQDPGSNGTALLNILSVDVGIN